MKRSACVPLRFIVSFRERKLGLLGALHPAVASAPAANQLAVLQHAIHELLGRPVPVAGLRQVPIDFADGHVPVVFIKEIDHILTRLRELDLVVMAQKLPVAVRERHMQGLVLAALADGVDDSDVALQPALKDPQRILHALVGDRAMQAVEDVLGL